MSEAQELREAARLMRERAQAASPTPWRLIDLRHQRRGGAYINGGDYYKVAHIPASNPNLWATAEHIAGWSPELAVVIADLVDDAAHQLELSGGSHSGTDDPAAIADALRIARTYMRSGS